MRLGIYTNIFKDKDLKVSKAIISEFSARGFEIYADSALKGLTANIYPSNELVKKSDYLIVVGGDGTILNIINECAVRQVPVLGVNTGTIGFLTEAEVADIKALPDILINNKFTLDDRYLLKAVFGNLTAHALNEIMVTRSGDFRLINFNVFVDDCLVDSYAADGFIISSPTGSTAYSLSCGGPILSPKINAIVLTPINPHTLHSRAIVINDTETAKVHILNERAGAGIVADGRLIGELKENETVSVTKSDLFTSFIRIKETNFYTRLFSKLDIWSTVKE